MKVLGIGGSPRRGGNTDILLAEVMRGALSMGATTRTIILNELNIRPCQHCDACLVAGQCTIQDDMQIVYHELESADRIILASPIHFMGLTAQMKSMVDRCQAFWARKYRLKVPPLGDRKERKGIFVSVGGWHIPSSSLFEPALVTVKTLFRTLDIIYAGELLFPGVDEKEAILKNPEALKEAYLIGQKLVS